jgi:hypothetical protein
VVVTEQQLALFEFVENGNGHVPMAALSRHVEAGPARLLRALVRDGLDEDALPAAAALVIELDAEAAAEGE